MAWGSRLAEAGKVFPAQFVLDFLNSWRRIVAAIVRSFFDPPPIGAHTVCRSFIFVAVVVVEHVGDVKWIPPLPWAANANRVVRHSPAFDPASPDSFWCFVHSAPSLHVYSQSSQARQSVSSAHDSTSSWRGSKGSPSFPRVTQKAETMPITFLRPSSGAGWSYLEVQFLRPYHSWV